MEDGNQKKRNGVITFRHPLPQKETHGDTHKHFLPLPKPNKMSFSEGVYNYNPVRGDGGTGREVHVCGELTGG